MVRKARLHVRGGLYHVTLRGNHRQPIFGDESDRSALESFVADAVVRHGVRLHAYCWMTNHIHLLAQVDDEPLGRLMQGIGSRYARFAQRRLDTIGHLFERRYYAVLVDAERYLLELVRYVHLNPVRGGLVRDPGDYRWSSHRCYLGREHRPWLTTGLVLGMLAADIGEAQAAYAAFVGAARGRRLVSPLVSGERPDARVLGGDAFVRQLPMPGPPAAARLTLDQLIAAACEESGIAPEELASPARSRRLSRVRIAVLEHALAGRIASCSEVARRLGRSAAALSQLRHRARQRPRERSASPRPEAESLQPPDMADV